MSIPKNRWKDIAFSSAFRYLHVVDSGEVTMAPGVHTIPLPEGYDAMMYRVYQNRDVSGFPNWTPVGGFFNTGTDARITPDGLVITYFNPGGSPPNITFQYFLYGGDYTDEA